MFSRPRISDASDSLESFTLASEEFEDIDGESVGVSSNPSYVEHPSFYVIPQLSVAGESPTAPPSTHSAQLISNVIVPPSSLHPKCSSCGARILPQKTYTSQSQQTSPKLLSMDRAFHSLSIGSEASDGNHTRARSSTPPVREINTPTPPATPESPSLRFSAARNTEGRTHPRTPTSSQRPQIRVHTTFTTTQPLSSFSVNFSQVVDEARPMTTPRARPSASRRPPTAPTPRSVSDGEEEDPSPPRAVSAVSRRTHIKTPSSSSSTPTPSSRRPLPRTPTSSVLSSSRARDSREGLRHEGASRGRDSREGLRHDGSSRSPSVVSPPARSSSHAPSLSAVGVTGSVDLTPRVAGCPRRVIVTPKGDCDPGELCPETRREFFVITWGKSIGVFQTFDVAKRYWSGCRLTVYESFADPLVAIDAYEDAVRHLSYCIMPRYNDYPDRSVIRRPPPPDLSRPYLRRDEEGTSAKYRVVFRGLRPGIYTSWLIAGPLVVGIKESLWRRYHTRDEAEDAWAQAKADGIVVELKLAREMDSRFLVFPDV